MQGGDPLPQSVRSLWADSCDAPALHSVFLQVSKSNASSNVGLPPGRGGGSQPRGDPHPVPPGSQIPGLNCTSHTQETPQTLLPRNLPKPQHARLQRWGSTEVTRWDGVLRVGAQGCAGEDPARSEAQGPPCNPGPGLQPPGRDRSASVAEVVRRARQLS